jgi:hypothetical protein
MHSRTFARTLQSDLRSNIFFELTAPFGKHIQNTEAYCPELMIWACPHCGCDILKACIRQHRGLWVQTVEPRAHWMRVGIDPFEFIQLTGISRVHNCGKARQ